LIFSERGQFRYDEENLLFRLGLSRGAIHLQSPSGTPGPTRVISFDKLDYAFDVRRLITSLADAVRPRQMSALELRDVVHQVRSGGDLSGLDERDPLEYELEIHRRLALPFAPLLFALLAIPLGLGKAARTRSRGAVISMVLAFAYYGLFTQARFLALDGLLDASWALWLPNVVFAILAIGLMIRVRHWI